MQSIQLIRKLGKLFSHKRKIDNTFSNLKNGEILSGKVIEKLTGKKYIIHLKGENIIAESENHLKEGNKYNFDVVNLKPKLTLKISAPSLKTNEGKIEFLNQLGLTHSKINLFILDILVSDKIDFNRNDLLNLISILKSLYPSMKNEDEIRDKARTALFLYRKGIPVTKSMVDNISYYLFNRPQLDKMMIELKILIKKYIDSESSSEREKALSILSYLDKIILKGDGINDFKILKDYLLLLGLDYESRILKIMNDENKLSEFQNQPVIKKDLLSLLMTLNEKISIISENTSFYLTLRSAIEKMLEFIEFQQLMNYNTGDKKEDFFYYYLLPFLYDDKIHPAEIIFKGRKKFQEISKKFTITIFAFINDECIEIVIDFFQKDLSIVFNSDNENILSVLERFQSDLKEAIQLLGFHIKEMKFNKSEDILKERNIFLSQILIDNTKKVNIVI